MFDFLLRFGLMGVAGVALLLACAGDLRALEPSVLAWGVAITAVSLTLLFAPQSQSDAAAPVIALYWSSASALAVLAVAATVLTTPLALTLAAVVWLQSLALQLALALCRTVAPPTDSLSWRLGLTAGWTALSLAPLWLGSLAQLLGSQSGWPDRIVSLSPASHLASAAQCDYLRQLWFYIHTPIGGLRFEYPALWSIIAVYATGCGLLWAATRYAARKPNKNLLELQIVRS